MREKARGHAQHLNILTLGTGKTMGFFFPNGVVGRINSTAGYDAVATGLDDFPYSSNVAGQVRILSMCPIGSNQRVNGIVMQRLLQGDQLLRLQLAFARLICVPLSHFFVALPLPCSRVCSAWQSDCELALSVRPLCGSIYRGLHFTAL